MFEMSGEMKQLCTQNLMKFMNEKAGTSIANYYFLIVYHPIVIGGYLNTFMLLFSFI